MVRFNHEGNCTTSLYREHLTETSRIPRISMIEVELRVDDCDPNVNWENQGPTEFHIKWHYAIPETHFLETAFRRKKRMLDLTHAVVSWVADRAGWRTGCCDIAYRKCIEQELQNQFFWPRDRRVMSPNRQLFARVFWDFGLEDIKLDLVIENRKGEELHRKRIGTLLAGDWFLFHALHTLKWKSNRAVVLESKNKLDRWEIKL